ncbi:hypothetical protein MMC07_005198 [Pseudocyphellaria aurata]|nr:hypothetical protein [Pseudocyphellaria aurata]
MGRLYGPYTCSVCQRPPPLLGWLYSCTQDDDQRISRDNGLAETASVDVNGIRGSVIPDERIKVQPAVATKLNPWVEKAIQEGKYTLEQITKLRAQRQKVVDAIAASEDYIQNHPENVSNILPQLSTSTSPSIDASTSHPPPSTPQGQYSKELEPPFTGAGPQPKPSMFPVCKLRYCQPCRPTFRDRTWMKFEDAFSTDSPIPTIDFEHDNRPISRVDLVRKLGLRKPRRSRHRSLDSAKRYSMNLTRQLLPSSLHNRLSTNSIPSHETPDQETEPESKGFRDGVRRAFRGMLRHRRRTSMSTRSSGKGKQGWDDAEFDIGLWRDLNEELLQEASSVPLPGHDGMDGLGTEEGEMEVEEGVAVTEEGVDLGTADIIMLV